MEERMEETSVVELEEHMALASDVEVGMVQVVVGHMAVDIAAGVGKCRMIAGNVAAEQEHHMAAGIVGVEVLHMVVDTVAVVALSRTLTSHLVPFCILVLVNESRTPTDHPSAVLPSLANLVVCNLVEVH